MNDISLPEKMALPPLDQIGFVVADIEKAMQDYAPLFGPWHVFDADIENADLRGKPASCKLRIAMAKSGDVEIELIEVLEGQSPHSEFLARGNSGAHHLRFRTLDIDAQIKDAKRFGYQPIWYKALSDSMIFCYLEKPGETLMLEFLQAPDLP
jgi:hypothetical protein